MTAAIMGNCAGCGVPIPWGYVPLVAPPDGRASEVPGLSAALQTVVRRVNLYCRRCPDSDEVLTTSTQHRRRRHTEVSEQIQEEEVKTLSAKEIAAAVYAALSDEPASSKKLLERAGLDEEYAEVALMVLKKLHEANKIRKIKTDEGKVRWASMKA